MPWFWGLLRDDQGKINHFVVSLVIGSVLVTAWTLLRFWTERSIFDLVGQQVLARTLLDLGLIDATVGATHYITKIFLVYIPFELLGIDPRISLILMTLLINIGAFVAMALAIRSILRQLRVSSSPGLAVGLVWLASTAGSIFWIEFANSRNIEVAAGLWTIALGLRFLNHPGVASGIQWLILAAITFFMDPLQIYMTGLPLLAYFAIALAAQHNRSNWREGTATFGAAAAALLGAYVLARMLLAVIVGATGITVISDTDSVLGLASVLGNIGEAIKGSVTSNVRIFAGYMEDGGRLRQVVAILGLGLALAIWTISVARRKITKSAVVFVLVFMVSIQVAYLASGQSINGDTSRYLIMAAPIIVIAIASISPSRLRHIALSGMFIVVLANTAYLLSVLPSAWHDRFSNDERLSVVAQLVGNSSNTTFYSSMDTALPAMFYHPGHTVLPLGCSEHRLTKSQTFYSSSAFDTLQARPAQYAAIILDGGDQITNHPSVCTRVDIEQQLGPPTLVKELSDGTRALYYPRQTIRF